MAALCVPVGQDSGSEAGWRTVCSGSSSPAGEEFRLQDVRPAAAALHRRLCKHFKRIISDPGWGTGSPWSPVTDINWFQSQEQTQLVSWSSWDFLTVFRSKLCSLSTCIPGFSSSVWREMLPWLLLATWKKKSDSWRLPGKRPELHSPVQSLCGDSE